MSSFFDNIKNNIENVEEELLGPDYIYWNKINSPSELGMSSDGNLSALGNDVNGLISYVELLVTGKGNASKTGGPLGNRFFLKTGAKCKDIKTKKEQTRYIYVDNIPQGNVPFISSGMGVDFSDFKGLIPGTISDLNKLNPFSLFTAFTAGSTPDCQELTMETTPSPTNENKSKDTQFVSVEDIKNMDPCIFTQYNKTNPVTKKTCKEAFELMNNTKTLKDDFILYSYIVVLCLFLIFLLYKIIKKNKMINFWETKILLDLFV